MIRLWGQRGTLRPCLLHAVTTAGVGIWVPPAREKLRASTPWLAAAQFLKAGRWGPSPLGVRPGPVSCPQRLLCSVQDQTFTGELLSRPVQEQVSKHKCHRVCQVNLRKGAEPGTMGPFINCSEMQSPAIRLGGRGQVCSWRWPRALLSPVTHSGPGLMRGKQDEIVSPPKMAG